MKNDEAFELNDAKVFEIKDSDLTGKLKHDMERMTKCEFIGELIRTFREQFIDSDIVICNGHVLKNRWGEVSNHILGVKNGR